MSTTTQKYHLLLVEDNAVNQRLGMRLLEKLGYVVDVASDGQEAIDCCASQLYDLVLMDCQMPIMDGFEATVAIRASQNAVPIVAMTGNVSQSDREICLNVGMNDYVSKPINFSILNETIKKWLPVVSVRDQMTD
jgi:two-component system sensor histidine kinase/response regulator